LIHTQAEVAEKGKTNKKTTGTLKPQEVVQYSLRHPLNVYNATSCSPSMKVLDDQLKHPVRPKLLE
jgi:hypothetical protein